MEDELKAVIKDAARRLTGFDRRSYQADIAKRYFGGSARKAERAMGWGRKTVEKGLKETESGIRCLDNFGGRGKKRTEEKLPPTFRTLTHKKIFYNLLPQKDI